MRMRQPILYSEEGDHCREITLPTRYAVCGTCDGHGKHSHAIDGNGITAREWNGPDWDDESRETYLSGGYDSTCEECQGERVVLVPDYDAMPPEMVKAWEAQQEADLAFAQECEAERRAGC